MRSIVAAALALALAACAPPAAWRADAPTAVPGLCRSREPFCVRAQEMELLLEETPLPIVAAEPVGEGHTHPRRLLLALSGGLLVRAKWKTSAPGGDGYNRSPRRELAAYALQKLFLAADDYVVPPTVARCLPETVFRSWIGGDATPTFPRTGCVLGVLTYWIEDADRLDGFSRERFDRDARYRRRIALLNVLTYLVDHHDPKPANFLVARGADPHAFSIDNGMAFSGWHTPRTWFLREWQALLVPALPRDTVARLRAITPAELAQLGTVVELRVDGSALVPVAPEAPFDRDRGVRRRGDRIQLGLTAREIDEVAARLARLLDEIDRREIAVF